MPANRASPRPRKAASSSNTMIESPPCIRRHLGTGSSRSHPVLDTDIPKQFRLAQCSRVRKQAHA